MDSADIAQSAWTLSRISVNCMYLLSTGSMDNGQGDSGNWRQWTMTTESMRGLTLMEIKGSSQFIAANKQQWCCLVAAASCGIVAACEFFVCKLVLLLLVAATLQLLISCRNLAALSCSNLVAPSCSNLAALSSSNLAALCVQRVCIGLVVYCF